MIVFLHGMNKNISKMKMNTKKTKSSLEQMKDIFFLVVIMFLLILIVLQISSLNNLNKQQQSESDLIEDYSSELTEEEIDQIEKNENYLNRVLKDTTE